MCSRNGGNPWTARCGNFRPNQPCRVPGAGKPSFAWWKSWPDSFIAIGSGLPKLFGQETAVEMFDDIGWGDWFRYLVGALEVLGGIGLILPKTTRLAAICLCGLMIGAVVFTLAYLEVNGTIVTPMILFALFAFIAWSRRTA